MKRALSISRAALKSSLGLKRKMPFSSVKYNRMIIINMNKFLFFDENMGESVPI